MTPSLSPALDQGTAGAVAPAVQVKRVSIFGLGYVGAVTATCLSQRGYQVVGVDSNPGKVEMIASGKSPIVEPGLGDGIAEAVREERLGATTDWRAAIMNTDLSLVCVGTPSLANGGIDLTYISRVCEQIGECLRDKPDYHVVCIRSTIMPGTMEDHIRPLLERVSGKQAGTDFGLCFNPEFLRESTAIADFFNPPKTVIGEIDARSGDAVASLYAGLDAPLIRTSIRVAELVKYVDNCWHALKVAFGNEIGALAKAAGVDSHAVMDIFCQDRKLNISPAYLKPGFAFGGSCLPKDLRAMLHFAKMENVELPVLESVLPSNRLQVERGFQLVAQYGRRAVGLVGLSFKAETDDLRESPLVELAEKLIGKGYDVRVLDSSVALARLTGANKEYILNAIPHISNLLVNDVSELLAHAETIVIGNRAPETVEVIERVAPHQHIIDLVRVQPNCPASMRNYEGISW